MDGPTTETPEKEIIHKSTIILLAAIFVITFISSVLPLQLVSNLRNVVDPEKRFLYRRIVSVLNCFGGGVFLGTALLDLLPLVISLIDTALPDYKFPFAEFIVAFGFLTILTTEQVAIDCKERTSDCRNPIERLQTRNVQLERETLTINTPEEPVQVKTSQILQKEEEKNLQTKFHSLLLLASLSLHSIFEGLTIGIIESSESALQVAVAILVHKVPIAFSVGLYLVQSELRLTTVIHLDLWFSLMTPIGAGIGVLLKVLAPDLQKDLIHGTFLGLATGTFIFIVFVEVLPKELKQGRSRLPNLLFLILGFSFVCATVLFQEKLH